MMREATLDELPGWLRDMHALWDAKRGARLYPARPDFVFEEFMPWLGRLHLVEVLDGDFRFAVFGSWTAELIKREYTGLKLSEIQEPLARIWEAGYRDVVARRAPVFVHHPKSRYNPRDPEVSWWRAILPMGTEDRLTHLLVGFQVIALDGRYL